MSKTLASTLLMSSRIWDHVTEATGRVCESPGVMIDGLGDGGLDLLGTIPSAERLVVEPATTRGRVTERGHDQSGTWLSGYPLRTIEPTELDQGRGDSIVGECFE
jgi:hypothetical protein